MTHPDDLRDRIAAAAEDYAAKHTDWTPAYGPPPLYMEGVLPVVREVIAAAIDAAADAGPNWNERRRLRNLAAQWRAGR